MNRRHLKETDREQALLDRARSSLKESAGLDLRLSASKEITGGAKAVIGLGAKDQQWAFPAVVKTRLTNDILGYAIAELKQKRRQRSVLIAPYVTPQQAERLRQANVQFLDGAGNAFLNQPPLYVFVKGNRPTENISAGRATRAFTATGLRVVFALLCNPALASAPYREIAAAAGASLGAVSQALDDLKSGGYLFDRGTGGRALANHRELLRRWCEAFSERLRPKLLISRFSADRADWWKEARPEKMNACWGGEVAAAKLTGYLKPQMKTIYAPDKLAALQVKFKFRQDRNGEIEILKKFWSFDGDPAHPDAAPAPLVYADLMASGDERNVETAEMIYDRYIARSFGQA